MEARLRFITSPFSGSTQVASLVCQRTARNEDNKRHTLVARFLTYLLILDRVDLSSIVAKIHTRANPGPSDVQTLPKVCESLQENPEWTGLPGVLSTPFTLSHLDEQGEPFAVVFA